MNNKPDNISWQDIKKRFKFMEEEYDASDGTLSNSNGIVEYVNVIQCNSCKRKFVPNVIKNAISQCPFCESLDIIDLESLNISELDNDIDII